MKRINIDFKVEKNGKLVKVQSEESVPTKTSELENDSGFITQAPETAVDNQTITKTTDNKLQTIGVKYNDNLITAEMIYNTTHYIRYKEDEPTPPTPTKEAGLYVNGVLTKSWAQLLSDEDIIVTDGALRVTNIDLADDLVCDNVEGLTSLNQAFISCRALTSIDASKLNTTNVTIMSNMFSDCSSLTSLDLSSFDTSNATEISGMFFSCSKLTSLDVSHFNTTKVTDMSDMFNSCSSLTSLDLSSFDTSKVRDMSRMFSDCARLTSLDLSSFNTTNVTETTGMFNNCSGLTSLNLSNFNTSNVTYTLNMFNNCSSLTSLDLSSFNTSNVTYMPNMFNNCSSLTSLDISNFTFDKVTNYTNMFTGVPNNCEILVKSQTEKDWITSKFTNLTNVKIKGTSTDGGRDDNFGSDIDWGL